MPATFKLNKKCKVCGKPLNDRNKSGFCIHHRDISGKNNPFYGKKHSKETIETIKKKNSETTKKLWQNKEYRNKVINNATGLKRSDEFKQKQKENALKQFKLKEQRDIRSKKMKASWNTGKITYIFHPQQNRSKQEINFFKELEKKLNDKILQNKKINYINENNETRWIFPDGVYKNFIIEFNGNYWHADPNKYLAEDIVHHNFKAKDIWERDNFKNKIYKQNGYSVIIVWADDYKKNKEKILNKIVKKLQS